MQSAISRTLIILLSLTLLVDESDGSAGQRKIGDSTIAYDDADLHWDKNVFDIPPKVIGGQAALLPWLEYPTALRRERIEGRTTVSVRVERSGAVSAISFSPRMHPDLESLVTRAVRKCRWTAGEKKGNPVAGNVLFPVIFALTKP